MATRLYLRTPTPTNNPGETELSAALPVGDFLDYTLPIRALDTTRGTSQTTLSGISQGHTDHDDEFFSSFSSEALAAQTITAQTWTVAIKHSQDSAFANSFIVLSLYVFREPSTIVGFIYDSDAALGAEWANNGAGRVATFSGSGVTVQAGDYLVFEAWRHTSGQGMNMTYIQTLFYNGTVDVTEGSTASAASYIETPQNLVFASAEGVSRRRVGFGSGRAVAF